MHSFVSRSDNFEWNRQHTSFSIFLSQKDFPLRIWSADIYLKCVSSLVEEMEGSSTAKFYMAYSIILNLLTPEPLIILKYYTK